ncbi:MAG: DNA-3-methyladenine glycosylase I, partial [Chlamydiia bacterium]|nr:DNA-3-methyladenine glycosylase I [Chlamydiia bacterium]
MKERCSWASEDKPLLADYHDTEWGIPVHEDQKHFELLSLEGQQAGLSWELILKKREAYRTLFHHFNPEKVAAMSDE